MLQRRACPGLQDITRVLGDTHITVTAQITARGLGRDQEVEPRVCMHCFKYLIHHFHRDQCTLSTPQILHNHCFQFPLGITVIPREIEDNAYAKFWGVHRVHYGLGENGQYQLLIHPMTGQLWRFEIWHFHRRNGFSGSGKTEVFKKDAYRLSPSSASEKKSPWLTKPRMPRDSAVPSLFPPFFAHSLFSVVSRLCISSALTPALAQAKQRRGKQFSHVLLLFYAVYCVIIDNTTS